MTSANIVLVMDNSSSMGPGQYNYLPYAQTDANTFVYIMQTGDNLGVSQFASNSSVVFGNTSSLIEITSKSVQDNATAQITALTAYGNTNMVEGINVAHSMIASSPNPRGIVFLSDGEYNVGGDPVPGMPTDIPFYTIALGSHGQTGTLQQMANKTNGKYYLAPNYIDLSDIYNEIVGDTNVAQVMVSKRQVVPQFVPAQTSATVSPGTQEISISVTWDNNSVVYTPNTPVGNEVNVSLKDPNGHVVQQAPYVVGSGFVVYKLVNPVPGPYTAIAWYSGGSTLVSTCGIFDPDDSIAMSAAADALMVEPNEPIVANAFVTEEGEVAPDTQISAELESPGDDYEALLAEHADSVDKHVKAKADQNTDADPSSLSARVAGLREHLGQTFEPRTIAIHPVHRNSDGTHTCTIANTALKGGYVLRLRADGTSPKTGRQFSRTKRVNVVVS